MDEGLVGGLLLATLGVVLVAANRSVGRLFRTYNSGFLISPKQAAKQYPADRRGRVWIVIAVGIAWFLAGIALIVSSL